MARVRQLAQEYPDLVVLLHGGGNFGDLYPGEMAVRLNAVKALHDIPIRFMPQSVHFGTPKRLAETARVLSGHPNVQLYVRDQPSYEFSVQHFASEGVPVYLSPDMAFMMGDQSDIRRSVNPSHDLLVFSRVDREGHHWNTTTAKPDGVSIVQGDWLNPPYFLKRPLPKDLSVLVSRTPSGCPALLAVAEEVTDDAAHFGNPLFRPTSAP